MADTLPHFHNEDLKSALESDLKNNSKFFTKLLQWLATPPLLTIIRVNTIKINVDDARKKLQIYLNSEYPDKFTVNKHPLINDILLIPSQKCNSNPPKDLISLPQVIVDIYCGAAVLRGANIFAPGVLAAPVDLTASSIVSVYVDLKGKCTKGLTKKFSGAKIFIGCGVAMLNRKEIFTQQCIKGVAVKMTEPICLCPSIGSCMEEYYFMQNLPSIVCGHVLDVRVGQSVLDMCAAPGGKTIHLATLLQNKGQITAIDKSQSRIHKITSNAKKFSLTNINTFAFDSTKLVSHNNTTKTNSAAPFSPETFDRILLDTPCSGLGQRPSFRIDMSLSQLKSYPRLQKKLFANAVQLLKVGGFLVYSTCTVTMAENEELVEWALKTYPCLELTNQVPYLGKSGFEGTNLSEKQLKLLQRFDFRCEEEINTNDEKIQQQTIGFFIAKFVKLKSI